MELNDIKKLLYKEKPKAKIMFIRKGKIYYDTTLKDGMNIIFEVPVDEMGDADFLPEMNAQLLNRWIVE